MRNDLLTVPLLLVVLLLLPGVALTQNHEIYNMSESASSSGPAAVACSPEGYTLVAWEEAPGEIWTRTLAGELQAPVFHGDGGNPVLCHAPDGFILAYTYGTTIRVRSGDGFSWGPINIVQSGNGYPTHRPDVSSATEQLPEEAYLVWEEGSYEVWFSRRILGVWQTPELVVTVEPMMEIASPQVAPTGIGRDIGPRVYYFDGVSELFYREHDGLGWSDPDTLVGNTYDMDMDVVAGPTLLHHMLVLAPQPPCPCNHLRYTRELPEGGWTNLERLTVLLDEYNWPQFPALAVGEDDVPHALWYQLFHDAELQPSGEAMYYFRLDGDTWTDHSEIFGSHIGTGNALTLDPQGRPALAWSETVASTRDVMLCRFVTGAGLPGSIVSMPLGLSVSPNPLEGPATFSFRLEMAGFARLELFDAAGRRVIRLGGEYCRPGDHQIVWDGRDARGIRVPAGVYQARLTGAGATADRAVVLVE